MIILISRFLNILYSQYNLLSLISYYYILNYSKLILRLKSLLANILWVNKIIFDKNKINKKITFYFITFFKRYHKLNFLKMLYKIKKYH